MDYCIVLVYLYLAEMNAIPENMYDGQEKGFLAHRIDANQEETKAMLDACLQKTEANL
jgi:hypothetical protein